MAIGKFLSKGFPGLLLGWVGRLRFPYIFLLMFALFLINLAIPDVIPFADEIIMGMVTLLLANLRKKPEDKIPVRQIDTDNTR